MRPLSVYLPQLQGAEGEIKRYILFVQDAFGRVIIRDEADVEYVLVGADLGDARQFVVQAEAQQLRHAAALHLLEAALVGRKMVRLAALAHQLEDDLQAVAYGQQGSQPCIEVIAPQHGILMQPVMVGGEVKFARPAGDAGALLDAHQPFVFAQVLAYLAAHAKQAAAGIFDFIKHRIQRFLRNLRVVVQDGELAFLAFQFLQQV